MKKYFLYGIIIVASYVTGLGLEVAVMQEDSKLQTAIATGDINERWIPFYTALPAQTSDNVFKWSENPNPFIQSAYLEETQQFIQNAFVDFEIEKVCKEIPNPNDDSSIQGDETIEYCRNLVTECIFKGDTSLDFETCVVCELTNGSPEHKVLSWGRTNLPSYSENTPVPVVIDQIEVEKGNEPLWVRGISLKICEQPGEGCTHGFWKTHSRYGPAPNDAWEETGYDPDDNFGETFGILFGQPIADKTLLEAMQNEGGGFNALGRDAVAALLNTASDVNYPISQLEVIQLVQNAYIQNDPDSTQTILNEFNEFGSPFCGDDDE